MRTKHAAPAVTVLAVIATVAAGVAGCSPSGGNPDGASAASSGGSPAVRPLDSASGTPVSVPRSPATLPTVGGPRATDRPVRLRMPAIDLTAPVRRVGVAADGQMQLPARPDVLGWYRFGPAPGSKAGAAVVAGHLDSRRWGLGPLVRLREAEVGDSIQVVSAAGVSTTYAVTAVRRFDRQALPVQLFARTGAPRLHLVTCGGAYDADAGGYQQNLVVTAEPA